MNPFAVLGLEPSMALDAGELERRYLELSRACHPDHQADLPPEEQIAMLQRAAQLNDAHRELADPWRRAAALIELGEPGALDATKQLDPPFLMDAMELAEEVAHCSPDAADALVARIEQAVMESMTGVESAIDAADWRGAARRLHESRYSRKALQDLESRR